MGFARVNEIFATASVGWALAAMMGCADVPETPTFVPDPTRPCLTEEDVRLQVLRPACGISDCHGGAEPEADLDLASPGITERLAGAMSVHESCGDRPLLTPAYPETSLLVLKVVAAQGPCGEPMPPANPLTPAQQRCIAQWVATMPPGDAPPAMAANPDISDGGAPDASR
jgi:hypothetical protein